MTTLLLLGDYSGRNTGHNAHLLSACSELHRAFGDCQVLVPTLSPDSIRPMCAGFDYIKPFGVAPWNVSIKFLGLPMLAALRRSQVLVLADNMFYDNHLYNPLKNNLAALLWLTRSARKRGIPVVYYNAGAGPARHSPGRAIIRRLAPRMDLSLLRDSESANLFRQLTGITDYSVSADSGFNMPWAVLGGEDTGDAGEPDARRNFIGVNISHHLQRWLAQQGSEREQHRHLTHIAGTFEALAARTGQRLVFIVAHPADSNITAKLTTGLSRTCFETWEENGTLVKKIAANIGRFQYLIGTRYHEIVLFASAGIPVLGLDCGEKLDGLFETLQCRENLVSIQTLSSDQGIALLSATVDRALSGRSGFRQVVEQLADRGMRGAEAVRQLIY